MMLIINKAEQRESALNYFNKEVLEKSQKIDKKKLYWICQVSGWSFYALINVVLIISFDVYNWRKILLALLLCAIGVGFTHIFRHFIKGWEWLGLPLRKIIPRVFAASIVIGTLMFSIMFSIAMLTNIYDVNQFKPATLLIGTFNLSIVILLWSLIYFSFHYFENYKRVEIESLIWENAVKEFELKTLRSQLNPHFMFNALNSIRALIREDPESAQTAVTKLSNILRYSLKIEKTETVPFEDEMQAVADYLALESIRFEERLKYRIYIDPKSSRIEIPPMMIQTLVENGIKHGISKRTEGGKIFINSRVTDSRLIVQIKNSGQINTEELKLSTGFGINNTKHRLSLLYGEKAFFILKNENEDEVLAELIIPKEGIKNESINS